jgi:hypothetical protein
VNVVGGYLVKHLMDDLASRTIWGSCQEPICWFWDRENKYLQHIITNTDLDNAFQMYWTSKVLTLVVQFELKLGYVRSISVEEKLLGKLSCTKNASQYVGDVDPTMMYDADIFVGDEQFYAALGFVHEYYSVERFKIAYSGTIPTITDKSQWPKLNLGFKLLPPKLKIGPGRKRKNRFKASHEPGARKLDKCKTCGEVGQHDPNCGVPKKRQVGKSVVPIFLMYCI